MKRVTSAPQEARTEADPSPDDDLATSDADGQETPSADAAVGSSAASDDDATAEDARPVAEAADSDAPRTGGDEREEDGADGAPGAGGAEGAAESAAAPRTGSWADRLWARWTATPALSLRTQWILVVAVTLLGAILRFWNLGHPGQLVFDETYYVKDGWTLVHLGYEAKWPEHANDAFNTGDPNGYLSDGSYVVHPPLGKLIIGLGMLIFGADTPFGWRAATAIVGTLAIPLLWWTARKLFRSPVLATIGAFLLAIDGHAIVLSRTALLDGILMFFVLLGFLFALYDREHQRARLATKITTWQARHGVDAGDVAPTPLSTTSSTPKTPPPGPDWGPALWWRPWFVAAALAFGAASAVKWSGLYFLAAFCIWSLCVDAWRRRQLGVTFWASAAILKQGPVSFLLAIPGAVALYLATWIPWLTTTGGFYRTWAEEAGHAWTGALSWVPLPLQSLWHYQVEAYNFHTGLRTTHPYQSSPLEWPFLLRPTAFSYDYSSSGDNPACHANQCVEAVTSLGNPLIWWLGTVAILFLVIMLFIERKWQYSAILTGFAAGYLPWLAYLSRPGVYNFYSIVYLPFLIFAILVVFQQVAGPPTSPARGRTVAINSLAVALVAISAVSVLFYPVWTGMLITNDYWNLTHWLPGWK